MSRPSTVPTRDSRAPIRAVPLSAVVAGSAWIALSPPRITISGLLTVALVLLLTLAVARNRRRYPNALLPVNLFLPLLLALNLWAGFLFYDSVSSGRGASAAISLTGDTGARTLQEFLLLCCATIAGYMLRDTKPATHPPRILGNLYRPQLPLPNLRILVIITTSLAFVSSALMVMGSGGLDAFILRPEYLPGRRGNIYILGQVLSILPPLGVGHSMALLTSVTSKQKLILKLLLLIATILQLAVFLGLGTRRLALLPLLLSAGYITARRKGTATLMIGLVSALLAVQLLQLPLQLRNLTQHGLQPYATALRSGEFDGNSVAGTAFARNLLFSFPLTGQIAYNEPPIPASSTLAAISPLPGGMSGWYEVQTELRINQNTPYNALGHLLNMGLVPGASLCFGLGILLNVADRRSAIYAATHRVFYSVALVGLLGMMALTSTQYSFRATTRFLYYAILVDALARSRVLYRLAPNSLKRFL